MEDEELQEESSFRMSDDDFSDDDEFGGDDEHDFDFGKADENEDDDPDSRFT